MDPWIVIALMIILSGFFSGMEIAYVSSNKLKIEIDRQKGLVSGRIFSNFMETPSELIATLLIGNNIALVIFGIAIAQVLDPWLVEVLPSTSKSEFLLLLTQTVIATLIILVTAEFLPKIVFRIFPNRFLKIFAVPVQIFFYLFYPIAKLFILTSRAGLRVFFGVRLKEERYTISSTDLDNYLHEFTAEDEDSEYKQEIQMLKNAREFRNVKMRECMIPRTEIIAAEITEDIDSILKKHIESGHSKILIYEDSIDNIVGYMHAFDIFRKPESIKSVMRPVLIVPETMLANNLMEQFIKKRKSLAVVVDEFGGTAGISTLEDVIEEIFGEIQDEFDKEELFEKQISETEFIFEARIEIDYLNEKYKLGIEVSEEYETLAGYIIHHHESIPQMHEQIVIENHRFTIVDVSETRIKKVKLLIEN